ncbi:double-CXXCG motif protein [Corallococcus sp. Z5C101001]|uniref:SitI6 family double-CXXCG motif immunity protein n=1 Tax=Corallococcus sp. Z5C101001 TaxID=2596829 RepID=UPI00163D5A2C|nr:double-CXXCG motif protein [Corallococcus sp. Z5C101001]
MKFFELHPADGPRFTGYINGVHKWGLPGGLCPVCHASPGGLGEAYPSVDLSGWAHRQELAEARQVPLEEYERLRDLLRSQVPFEAPLLPGAEFGTLSGKASGKWGDLHLPDPWMLVMRRDALKRMRDDQGISLHASNIDLRFLGREEVDLLELELHCQGRLHDSCFPGGREPPCERCGRQGGRLPDAPMLDGRTLTTDSDLFRLRDYTTVIIASERFVDAVARLGLEGVVFKEVPVVGPV